MFSTLTKALSSLLFIGFAQEVYASPDVPQDNQVEEASVQKNLFLLELSGDHIIVSESEWSFAYERLLYKNIGLQIGYGVDGSLGLNLKYHMQPSLVSNSISLGYTHATQDKHGMTDHLWSLNYSARSTESLLSSRIGIGVSDAAPFITGGISLIIPSKKMLSQKPRKKSTNLARGFRIGACAGILDSGCSGVGVTLSGVLDYVGFSVSAGAGLAANTQLYIAKPSATIRPFVYGGMHASLIPIGIGLGANGGVGLDFHRKNKLIISPRVGLGVASISLLDNRDKSMLTPGGSLNISKAF